MIYPIPSYHCIFVDRYDSYRMFEVNMDEYLDEEVEYLKQIFDNICKSWDRQVLSVLLSVRI